MAGVKVTLCTTLFSAWMLMILCGKALADDGTATYYTPPYVPSACYGFDQNQFPSGDLFAAASEEIWDGGNACGNYYSITCTGGTNDGVPVPCKYSTGTTTVKIVDLCPSPGCQGTFDLSQQAFDDIAELAEGKIVISYTRL